MDGATLELRRELGGLRHYLLGEPIHAGSILEYLADDGKWIEGRYEWTFQENDLPSLTICDEPGNELILFIYPDMLCRWKA